MSRPSSRIAISWKCWPSGVRNSTNEKPAKPPTPRASMIRPSWSKTIGLWPSSWNRMPAKLSKVTSTGEPFRRIGPRSCTETEAVGTASHAANPLRTIWVAAALSSMPSGPWSVLKNARPSCQVTGPETELTRRGLPAWLDEALPATMIPARRNRAPERRIPRDIDRREVIATPPSLRRSNAPPWPPSPRGEAGPFPASQTGRRRA